MFDAIKKFIKKESVPMRQETYWIMYLAVGLTMVMKTIEVSAYASFDIILRHPEVAAHSWLVQPFFLL